MYNTKAWRGRTYLYKFETSWKKDLRELFHYIREFQIMNIIASFNTPGIILFHNK